MKNKTQQKFLSTKPLHRVVIRGPLFYLRESRYCDSIGRNFFILIELKNNIFALGYLRKTWVIFFFISQEIAAKMSASASSSSSPLPPSPSAIAVRTPVSSHESASRFHRRCVITEHRAMLYRIPVGENVLALVDAHAFHPVLLRSTRDYFDDLSEAEKSSTAGGGNIVHNHFKSLGGNIDCLLATEPVDPPGTLTIPLGLAAVFSSTYAYIDKMWPLHHERGLRNPRNAGETRRTHLSAMNHVGTSASYFMRAIQCTSSTVHAFIRDKRESSVTISYKEKPYTDLSEIDILAAIDPKRAFAIMNVLFEIMSYTCFDERQDAGFSSRMIPAGETFNTPKAIYGRGIHALTLQAVAGASNTVVGHACFLFIVLTQLDEIEYGQYCKRMGLPNDLIVPGRRYSFQVTDPCTVGGTMMVPSGSISSPSTITQYIMSPMTPERDTERKRSFDESHSSMSPPLAPKTSKSTRPAEPTKWKKDDAHWDRVARAKHTELMSVVEKAEVALATAKEAVSGTKRSRSSLVRPGAIPTGKTSMVVEERLRPLEFKDRTVAYDVPPVKRHRGDVFIPPTSADRDALPDLKCHESIEDVEMSISTKPSRQNSVIDDDDSTPIDPEAGHASDYDVSSDASDTSDDDYPRYYTINDGGYDSL